MKAILENLNPLEKLQEIKKESELNSRIFEQAINYSKSEAVKFWDRFNSDHLNEVLNMKLTLKTI